jgi:hypothetical protein
MAHFEETDRTKDAPEHFRKMVFRGWLIVCGIAVAFVLYGFFAFFVIGDRQPAEWDFGEIEDIPGESAYSTFPYRAEEPDVQHIDAKPPKARTTISDNPPPPPGWEEKGFHEAVRRQGTGKPGQNESASSTR